ncbi:hypothetical protein FHT40_004976 [Mycolicibacterium sp. BK556]|uniref:hypothetical protein n=1 Tax=Mycobacteriaceae TaxID=1762 RepID=UPI00105D572F|nr:MULTISPECIES: hypothetical protein [Mycobacteriaceae]MBB3605292.1 hypothetical protein [Mycolicibacterium sp. BK556]MBB3635488.1 hypothetical protein [Mycolicibacterium sp. BK607]MBB3747718.1 hypothetical protein [Mycolicibacterium sp. BK634]TDO08146.1 hypothetical protein EV580_5717 [Mycobacterium sp. BK086]
MWARVAEIVLIGWIVIAIGIFVVTFIWRFGTSGTMWTGPDIARMGAYAPTPKPEWVIESAQDEDPDADPSIQLPNSP